MDAIHVYRERLEMQAIISDLRAENHAITRKNDLINGCISNALECIAGDSHYLSRIMAAKSELEKARKL